MSQSPPHITILLAVYNGADALQPQLDSYLQQTLLPARILISDDGSTDGSADRLNRFAEIARARGIVCDLIRGPGRGPAANFLALLARTDPNTDYVALSDQDDIWLPGKLEDAVHRLSPVNACPALLGTRSWEWDSASNRRKLSRPIPEPHDFRHALVQNYAGGNTMVLNRAALALVQRALPRVRDVAVHDWWLYQFISGAGGNILLGQTPHILYRQHGGNHIGANRGLGSKLSRFGAMLRGTYRDWNERNIAALEANADLLTPEARDILARFAAGRRAALPARLAMLRATQLHRKGMLNQAALWVAALMNRL